MGCKNSKFVEGGGGATHKDNDDDNEQLYAHRHASHDNLVQVHRAATPKKESFRKAKSSSVSNGNSNGNGIDEKKARFVFDDYAVVRNLGTGSLGSVDLVVRKENGLCSSPSDKRSSFDRPYALKSIITTALSKSATDELRNEIVLLRTLDHPNIVRLYSVYETHDNVYLVMQVCQFTLDR